ncbi:MAG: Slp family lipoprotein [Desulfobacterota bacterium]|nr:Slp family lipoprotein [Thermodesulfobacteriota bacterium]
MTTLSRAICLFLFLFLSGCAHVISKDLRVKANPALTLSQVRQDPEAYKGRWVVWGGEIIETVSLREGATQIEVYQRPLGWRGEPKGGAYSEGRFLVLSEKWLDPYPLRSGRRITVAGEILGAKLKPLGEMDYRYPLVAGKQIHLWPEPIYLYDPYPYLFDPWWYYGPRWYWGFGFHYYHRRR